MKVWQAGSHLTDQRAAQVDDWSWAQTRRRLGMLVRLAGPYPGRTVLAGVTLVVYTLVALLPRNPWLADWLLLQALAHATDGDPPTLPGLPDELEAAAFRVAAARARTRGGRRS